MSSSTTSASIVQRMSPPVILDRVVEIVTRTIWPSARRSMAVVNVVERDDLVEVLGTALGVTVKELAYDLVGS